MTAREMHRAYTREVVRRLRTAVAEMATHKLSTADTEAFHRGCRTDGWVARGFCRVLVLRLAKAGLVEDPAILQMFGTRLTEARLTERGRGLWWRLEEAYADTMPMLRAALKQKAAERAAEAAGGARDR